MADAGIIQGTTVASPRCATPGIAEAGDEPDAFEADRSSDEGASALEEQLLEECQGKVSCILADYVNKMAEAKLGTAREQISKSLQQAFDERRQQLEKDYLERCASLDKEQLVKISELEARQAKLEADERTFAERLEAESAKIAFTQNRIRLDVGGTQFSTSRSTLVRVPASMLEAMFSGRHEVVPEEDGVFFIDRDGRHFHHVLNYLRDGDMWAPPGDKAVCQELRREAEFYGLPGLVEALCPHNFGFKLIRKSTNLELSDCTLTLTQSSNLWTAGALFSPPATGKESHFEFTVRLHQPGATHQFMLGIAPSSINLDHSNVYMSCGFYLFDYSAPMLYGQGTGSLLNIRANLQPGETLKLIFRKNDHGGTLSFAAGNDPPVVAYTSIPLGMDYCPVVLMNTQAMSLSIVELETL